MNNNTNNSGSGEKSDGNDNDNELTYGIFVFLFSVFIIFLLIGFTILIYKFVFKKKFKIFPCIRKLFKKKQKVHPRRSLRPPHIRNMIPDNKKISIGRPIDQEISNGQIINPWIESVCLDGGMKFISTNANKNENNKKNNNDDNKG